VLSDLLDKFEEVIAEGTNPQKKDLLRRLVKKVLAHDRRTVEIWGALPNQASVRTPGYLARWTPPSLRAGCGLTRRVAPFVRSGLGSGSQLGCPTI
jgi:hypothetical protein